jgi:hypothetical protein
MDLRSSFFAMAIKITRVKREDDGYVGSLCDFDESLFSLPRPSSRRMDVYNIDISSAQSFV